MKKAILLSVSLGVLGFASPFAYDQEASADTISDGAVVSGDRQIKVTKEFYVRTMNGHEQHLKSVDVTLELNEDGQLVVPVEPGFTTKQSVLSFANGARKKIDIRYDGLPATVTVHYKDENGNTIGEDHSFNKGTVNGNYKISGGYSVLQHYDIVNSDLLSGKILSDNFDVNLIYRNIDPIQSQEMRSAVREAAKEISVQDDKVSSDSKTENDLITKVEVKVKDTADSAPLNSEGEELVEKLNPKSENDTSDDVSKAKTNVDVTAGQDTNDGELSGKTAPDLKTDIAGDSDTTNGVSISADTKESPTQQSHFTNDESQSSHDKHEATNDVSKNASADKGTVIEEPNATQNKKETGHPETLKVDDKQQAHETPAVPKSAPEKVPDAPAKSTSKPVSDKDAVKVSEPDKKVTVKTSEEITARSKKTTDVKETDHSLEKTEEVKNTAKASQTSEAYQLHGIDSHGNSLFNKTVRLTPSEAVNSRTKNIEFYGYDLQSTDLNTHSKVLTLHYVAKLVTFNIVNVDQDGKTLSKDAVQLDFGQTKTYTAKFIPGYQADQPSKELNADNIMPEQVQFTYTKLADTPNQSIQERHIAATKGDDGKHKHGHADKTDTADNHQPDDKAKAVHKSADTEEKLPQTGDHNSYFSVLTGVTLLIALMGKKLFKGLNRL